MNVLRFWLLELESRGPRNYGSPKEPHVRGPHSWRPFGTLGSLQGGLREVLGRRNSGSPYKGSQIPLNQVRVLGFRVLAPFRVYSLLEEY